jgi:DNA-binding CsgD family transcriptional regulator
MSAIRISVPGRPIELVRDVDPHEVLTPYQLRTLDLIRAYNGNRSRVARHLGVTPQTVQFTVRRIMRRGVAVPPRARYGGRGPDLLPRRRAA